mmetsp:Transcript_40552/g.69929  ORF Transcript_40552/g.69929 Transcript_40552/m.69929 type:complete len:374 (-) Transcript_40552:327-1448(-)|eukprot:CAMPEP_0206382288 /NCGR_PEP_ID=MMETSP0294-20121207/13171_1 /ASSEMBLY_ACC=CAM_ASM_000327 /TAXON_ID=39354 /ORGANISM="Heterosigma akashiwo, Strain CCMP2393" /LENGTH=373 /DNA_ID=CAMNT_0053831941 /DNA_START=155 /DNA_END=1276 /DNA_ORIENTATION=+
MNARDVPALTAAAICCSCLLFVFLFSRLPSALQDDAAAGDLLPAPAQNKQEGPQYNVDSAPESNLVCLNVGGMKYQTAIQTLRSVPGSMLERLVSNSDHAASPGLVGDNGCLFFDRNGNAFAHVLEFLRNSAVPSWSLPLAEAEELKREAVYYELGDLEAWATERLRDRRLTVFSLKGWVNTALSNENRRFCVVDVSYMDASGLDLRGFHFRECMLGATETNFQDVHFEGSALSGSFAGANFVGSNMQRVSVGSAYFDNLAGADLRGAVFENSRFSIHTSFKGANLEGAKFTRCQVLKAERASLWKDQGKVFQFNHWNIQEGDSRPLELSDFDGAVNAEYASLSWPGADKYFRRQRQEEEEVVEDFYRVHTYV